MNQDLELETKLIDRFISKRKKNRYKSFVINQKLRQKFINELAHSVELDYSLFFEVKGNKQEVTKEIISSIGKARDCYIVSENKKIDCCRLKVSEAIEETIGLGMGTFLIFRDIDLVYYEGEDPNDQWIAKSK